MAFDIGKNKRNKELESNGIWMDYDEDVRFLVARKNNPKYRGAVSRGYRENERVISSTVNTDRADKVAEKLMLEAFCAYILLDWEGLVDSTGKEVKYTPEIAFAVLTDHDDLKDEIEAFADNRENYILEKDAKDAKNLKK